MSAQALANAVSMDEAFFRAVVQKLYEIVTKEGDDARTAMAKKLMATWGDKDYDENALQFVMLSPTHAATVEEQLKIDQIGYMTFNDNYGNKCFIVDSDNKARLDDIIMSTIGFDPKYNKELSANKFLEYAHDNKTEDIISIEFDNQQEAIDFKNKCYANKHGFVVADYERPDGKVVVMALAKNFKTNNSEIDFITALSNKAISDVEKGSRSQAQELSKLKDAALIYDMETQKEALAKITNKESFVIGNERTNNAPYIEYDAEKNNITIYDYNESTRSYGVSQEFDLSDFNLYDSKDREAMQATLTKYFDAVDNATIYSAQDFSEHLSKDNSELENEYFDRRFKEYEQVFNTLALYDSLNQMKPEDISKMCVGRPNYDIKMLEKFKTKITEEKQALCEQYGFSENDKCLSTVGNITKERKEKFTSLLNNIQHTHPELYTKIQDELLKTTKEEYPDTYSNVMKSKDIDEGLRTYFTDANDMKLNKDIIKLIQSTNDKALIQQASEFNAFTQMSVDCLVDFNRIDGVIAQVKGISDIEKDIKEELNEALKNAITPKEIHNELEKLQLKYEELEAKSTSEVDKDKYENKAKVFKDIKTHIEKTDVKRYDEVEIDITKSQVQEKENEHERE